MTKFTKKSVLVTVAGLAYLVSADTTDIALAPDQELLATEAPIALETPFIADKLAEEHVDDASKVATEETAESAISDPVGSSLLEMSAAAKASAAMKSKLLAANKAVEESRAKTDAILSKLHSQMTKLNKDLAETSKQEKEELKQLDKERIEENKKLEASEKKMQETMEKILDRKPPTAPNGSSFIEGDFLTPLRNAALKAKALAEKLRAKAKKIAVSFISAKDLGKENATEEVRKAEKEAGLPEAILDATPVPETSFIQTAATSETKDRSDPLSAAALNEWHEHFEEELQKARSSAGLPPLMSGSFLQKNGKTSDMPDFFGGASESDSRIAQEKKEVAKMEQSFTEQLNKLKLQNSELLAEAQAEVEKSKEVKERLDAEATKSSFAEMGTGQPTFNAEKEAEKIKEMEKKWERSASKLSQETRPIDGSGDPELDAKLEKEKEQASAAEAELEQLKGKVSKDLANLNKDMALNKLDAKKAAEGAKNKPFLTSLLQKVQVN